MTTAITSITTRDREEIVDLYARYAYLVDNGDYQSWAECYTPTGALHIPAIGMKAQGPDELIEFAGAQASRLKGAMRHLFFNVLVDTDGDRVRGRAYILLVSGGWGRHAPVIDTSGRYEDELEKLPAGWRFAQRTLVLDEQS
jgi:3-phenylpropionate/cinnamic acid dioxygenase small subunit